jgi:virginiamycin B lyase
MTRRSPLAFLVPVTCGFALLLNACSGNVTPAVPSSTSALAAAQTMHPDHRKKRVRIKVRMTILGGRKHHRPGKHAKFISPATDGVLSQVYAQSDPGRQHLLGESAIDVSSGSAACGGQTGYPRTCTVTIPAPPGADTFVFTTYDAIPQAGKFPTTAHALGVGSLAQTIVEDQPNTLAIYISGVIDAIRGVPAFTSFAGNGSVQTYGFVLQPEDFNDDPISAGPLDPYANPIALTLVETGGSGHAFLSLNGGAGTSSIVSRFSTDSIKLVYDGGGTPGYGMAVAISASGVATQTLDLSPLYVSSTSPFFASSGLAFYGTGQSATLNIAELDAPSSQTYSAVPNTGCSQVANVGSVSGSGPAASVTVTAGTAASPSGCTIAISDGTSTLDVPAVNTTTGVGVTVPTAVIDEFPIVTAGPSLTPVGITAGSDGAVWFGIATVGVGRIPVDAVPGSSAQIAQYGIPGGGGGGFFITTGADGALWFTDETSQTVDRLPTNALPGLNNAAIAQYDPTGSGLLGPSRLAPGADGNVWINDDTADVVGGMNLGGGIVQTANVGDTTGGIAVAPTGDTWFASAANPELFDVSTGGTVTPFALPAGSQIGDLAFDFAGNLWMSDRGHTSIEELAPGGSSVASFPVPGGGEANGLAIGPDGAVWFTDPVRKVIGRMTTSGVFAPSAGYPIPTAGAAANQIAVGPDGALWFTETLANQIGRLVPGGTPSLRRRVKVFANYQEGRVGYVSAKKSGEPAARCGRGPNGGDCAGGLRLPWGQAQR